METKIEAVDQAFLSDRIAEIAGRPWVATVNSGDSVAVCLSPGWVFKGTRSSVAAFDRVFDALIATQFVNVSYFGDENLLGFAGVGKALVDGSIYAGQVMFDRSRPRVYYTTPAALAQNFFAVADYRALRAVLGEWLLAFADGGDLVQLQEDIERYATRFAFWASDGRYAATVEAWQYAGDERVCCYAADTSWYDFDLAAYVREKWGRGYYGAAEKASGDVQGKLCITIDGRKCSVSWWDRWSYAWSV